LVPPSFFRTHLYFDVEIGARDKWHAKIAARRALEKPVEAYHWEFEVSEIAALLLTDAGRAPPSAPQTTGRKPGRRIKKNWRLTAAIELVHFMKENGRTPTGSELADRVDMRLKYSPDESDCRKLIRFLVDE